MLYVMLALPPPGLITGWTELHPTRALCVEAANRAQHLDKRGRAGYERAELTTHCQRIR